MTACSGARRDCDGGAAYAMGELAAAFFMTGGRLAVADFAPHDSSSCASSTPPGGSASPAR